MPIQVVWDNESKTVIRFDFSKQWDWEEFWTAVRQSDTMMTAMPYRVDLIANFEGSASPPLGALGQFKRAIQEMAPSRSIVLIVPGSLLIDLLTSTFMRIYPTLGRNLTVASSVEEARQILAERSRNMPPG